MSVDVLNIGLLYVSYTSLSLKIWTVTNNVTKRRMSAKKLFMFIIKTEDQILKLNYLFCVMKLLTMR